MAANGNGETPKRAAPGLSRDATDNVKRQVLLGVGYRRPPEHSRFKKGQSGNPKGRPKRQDTAGEGSRLARSLILKEAERLVTIREGEETRQMPAIEVILRAQTKAAANGNAYAQKHMIDRFTWADRHRQEEIDVSNAFWRKYIDWHRQKMAEAEAGGEPSPASLPHPDDVVIDNETGVRFIGPVDEIWAAKLEETIKVRDILIMQDALDHRLVEDPEGHDRPSTALLFAILLDKGVPARFRLSKAEWTERMIRYDQMPKRELLKAVCRAWKELGRPTPRGRTFPPLRWGEQQIDNLAVALEEIATPHESGA